MLGMDRVHVIRDKVLREGRSIRSVAQELGVSRVTVRKYLTQSAPVRVETSPRAQPARESVRERFEELWREWKLRSSGKHRVTAARIHRQLVSEGEKISAVTVRRMVRERRLAESEVFVPLVHRPGESGQVDFFEMTVVIAALARQVWMFLLHLPSSGRSFVRLYERCDQLSFLDGHVGAFEALGGLPERLVYDNLSAAVNELGRLHRRFQRGRVGHGD
jgi:transposase